MIDVEYGDWRLRSGEGNRGSFVFVKREGKGPIPDDLKGMYTSVNMAKRAVDDYQKSLRPRVNASN